LSEIINSCQRVNNGKNIFKPLNLGLIFLRKKSLKHRWEKHLSVISINISTGSTRFKNEFSIFMFRVGVCRELLGRYGTKICALVLGTKLIRFRTPRNECQPAVPTGIQPPPPDRNSIFPFV
jgi:hypothetical protein